MGLVTRSPPPEPFGVRRRGHRNQRAWDGRDQPLLRLHVALRRNQTAGLGGAGLGGVIDAEPTRESRERR